MRVHSYPCMYNTSTCIPFDHKCTKHTPKCIVHPLSCRKPSALSSPLSRPSFRLHLWRVQVCTKMEHLIAKGVHKEVIGHLRTMERRVYWDSCKTEGALCIEGVLGVSLK